MRKLGFLFFPLLWTSCNEIEDCQLDPYVSYMGIDIELREREDRDIVLAFDSVRLDEVGLFDVDTSNTTLKDTITSQIFLPINISRNSSTFRFFTDSVDYFVTIAYESEAYIYETDCNAGIRYFDLRVSETNLDSVRIVSDELVLNRLNNLEIYF